MGLTGEPNLLFSIITYHFPLRLIKKTCISKVLFWNIMWCILHACVILFNCILCFVYFFYYKSIYLITEVKRLHFRFWPCIKERQKQPSKHLHPASLWPFNSCKAQQMIIRSAHHYSTASLCAHGGGGSGRWGVEPVQMVDWADFDCEFELSFLF